MTSQHSDISSFRPPIVAVLGLELLQLVLQLLHGQHRPCALEGQREQQDHDRQRQQRDGDGIVGIEPVEELQRLRDEVVHQATVRSWW